MWRRVNRGRDNEREESAKVARVEAERGDPGAQVAVGLMYLTGRSVEPDAHVAVEWLRKAANQDDPAAQYNLGIVYDTGFHGMLPQDPVEALMWFRRAASQGHDGAQYNLGVAYAEAKGVPQDHVGAIKWWRKAAEAGNARAQYNLGVSYSKGEGVARDDGQAVIWWQRAALPPGPSSGSERAWLSHEEGEARRGAGDLGRGDHGYAEAQYHLGRMHALGRGVARDRRRAAEWFRRAAAQGHVDARAALTGRLWRRVLLVAGVALVVAIVAITL